jgi:hypothetical protein
MIRKIADRARESGKSFAEMRIDMERPEFSDGTLGYFRLNTLIVIDERSSLRLNTSALGIIRRFFHEHDEDIQEAIAEVRRRNARIDDRLQDEPQRDRFRGLDRDPGDGRDGRAQGPSAEEEEPDDEGGEQPTPENQEPQARRRTRRAP